jgi:hypothetical protein
MIDCDNQRAIFLAKNSAYHSKTKHIDIQYHFVRDMVEEKKVLLMKVDTLKNVADSLTKSMITKKFSWCRGSMDIAALDCRLCNPVTLCMQRKQQVGECWVCVVFFSRLELVSSTLRRGSGVVSPIICFLGEHVAFLLCFSCHLDFRVHCWEVY